MSTRRSGSAESRRAVSPARPLRRAASRAPGGAPVPRPRVPTQAPAAPSASIAARPRPSSMPPAATPRTGATASTTRGTSARGGEGSPDVPACPQPCATTTSAPTAAAARASSAVPTVAHTTAPPSYAAPMSSPASPQEERHDAHAGIEHSGEPVVLVPRQAEVDAERPPSAGASPQQPPVSPRATSR